jgi:sucrose phosphorylase
LSDIAPKVTDQLELHTEFIEHFQRIYGPGEVDKYIARLEKLIGKYAPDIPIPGEEGEKWTEKDSILITYGDVLRDLNRPAECRLDILEEFLEKYVKDSVSAIHILPNFPSSTDAGFSVIN